MVGPHILTTLANVPRELYPAATHLVVNKNKLSVQKTTFKYGKPLPELMVDNANQFCTLNATEMEEPSLFPNSSPNCKPIAVKSWHFNKEDQFFINKEIRNLFSEGIIKESVSQWRSSLVVIKVPTDCHKKQMRVDYSQTINQYTELDVYPLPRINKMINELAKYSVFPLFDLKSAKHQVPLKVSHRKFIASGVNGRLFQFRRISFGVKNGVASF